MKTSFFIWPLCPLYFNMKWCPKLTLSRDCFIENLIQNSKYMFCLHIKRDQQEKQSLWGFSPLLQQQMWWEVTWKFPVQISEVHLLTEEQWLEQESLSSVRSGVIVEVKCLRESDTAVVGFSQFHAGSPSLCYDISYWFNVNWLSNPPSYYTA